MNETQPIRTGKCLCGSVRYEVTGGPQIVAHCFCDDCQRLSGAGHSTGAMFEASAFKLTGNVGEYDLVANSGSVVTRTFCPSCGSPICGRNTAMLGFVTICLGTFDESTGLVPSVAIFTRNRKSWDAEDESIEAYEAQPAFKPGEQGDLAD